MKPKERGLTKYMLKFKIADHRELEKRLFVLIFYDPGLLRTSLLTFSDGLPVLDFGQIYVAQVSGQWQVTGEVDHQGVSHPPRDLAITITSLSDHPLRLRPRSDLPLLATFSGNAPSAHNLLNFFGTF